MDVSEEKLTNIQSAIVEKIAQALEEEKVAEDELPEIATFVLEKTNNITTEEQLLLFLDDLAQKWPFFEPIEELEKGREREKGEEQVVEDVLKLAKSGQINEAVDLAKTVTQ